MRYKIIWLISVVFYFLTHSDSVLAQKGTVKGVVRDAVTNEVLPFTNIVVYGTNYGSSTNVEGYFEINGLTPGYIKLSVSQVGYEPFISPDFLVTNARVVYQNIQLTRISLNLEEVVVKASPFERKAESPLSMRRLNISEIERNPGANRDISRVIQSLPGVASSVSYRNDVIVRGGGPAENRFYLDGVEVPNLNHFATQGASGGPVGIINADFLREVEFYSGAFPASRGNALSSVLEMYQKDGNPDRLRFRGALGASDLSLTMDGPLGDKSSMVFSYRRSYLQFLFDVIGLPFLPTYNDYQFKYKTRFDDKNELTILSIGSLDDFSLNTGIKNPDEEQRFILGYLPVNTQWSYTIGAVYKHYRKNGFDTWVLSRNMLRNESYKYRDNDESSPDNLISDYTSDEIENKLRYERVLLLDGYKLQWGAGVEYAKYRNASFFKRPTLDSVFVINYQTSIELLKGNVFFQVSKRYFSDRLLLSAGVRTDFSDYSSDMNNPLQQLSPRISASYVLTGDLNINFNAGRYHQLPAYTTLGFKDNAGNLVNKENRITYISSNHLVGGLEYIPTENSRITAEVFYKTYGNYPFSIADSVSLASKGVDFGVVGDELVSPTGIGRAYGFELMARSLDLRGFNILLSYTWVRSEFKDRKDEYIPSSWDNKHILNLTVSRSLGRNWDLGAKWRFVGGAPYTPYDMELSGLRSAWDVSGRAYLDYGQYNSLRLDNFHQLDVRVDKTWYFDKISLMAYFDIQNLYNFKSKQPDYITNLDSEGIPMVNPADPEKYILRSVKNTAGQVLPTIGIMLEF